MSSEVSAASSAVTASCAAGATLTTVVSTSTITTTLPLVTNTVHAVITATFTYEVFGTSGPIVTTFFVQTQRIASIPTATEYRPFTYTTCIPASPSSTMVGTTPTATSIRASHQPQASDHRTLIISTVAGGVVGILAIALSFWMWLRRKRKLVLASRKQITETIDSPYSTGKIVNRKFSIGTTVNGTDFTNPTVRDYVGSMPSISQRNLARPSTDIRSVVYTDWSNIQRSTTSFQPHHIPSVNNQEQEQERVSAVPSQSQDPYTANYNPFYSPESSRAVTTMPATTSYLSRGSSAFLRPANSAIGTQLRDVSDGLSYEQTLRPTVYSPDLVGPVLPYQEQDDQRVASVSAYSRPDDSSEQIPRSPSREFAWAEALRRLENIHEGLPVDFIRDPTTSNQVGVTSQEFQVDQSEAPGMSDDGDYETIMYQSENESRVQSMRGHGRDVTDGSVFSVDAVLRRIANQPPRTRDRT